MSMYAQAGNASNVSYQGSQQGSQQSALCTPVARTIASASSRMDAANDRLLKVRDNLSQIADQLGALRAVPPSMDGGKQTAPMGVVGRLNDSADYSHRNLSEIEDLLSSIAGALG